jgi:hypothetical protein
MKISPTPKNREVEPKVFALLVKFSQGQLLYVGVHYALEEAFTAALHRLEDLPQFTPGEDVDIDLWNSMTARETIENILLPPGVSEMVPIPTKIIDREITNTAREAPVSEELQVYFKWRNEMDAAEEKRKSKRKK